MIDKIALSLTKHPLSFVARLCVRFKIRPIHITLCGIPCALLAFGAILFHWYILAGIGIIINRILDGLDGTVARITNTSSVSGGYVDIVADYIFYASIPLAHGLANPQQNMIPSMLVLSVYILSGVNFLATSSAMSALGKKSQDFPQKKLFYITNIIEGTETILFLSISTFFPRTFPLLGYITFFAILATLPFTIYSRWNMIRILEKAGEPSGSTLHQKNQNPDKHNIP